MSDSPKCIDISHWQGTPDFQKVRAAGVLAVIMKATEGTSYRDPVRQTNAVAARRAGLAVATYHWLKPGNAAAQMDFYLKTIQPVPGERVIIDYEEKGCVLADLTTAVAFLLAHPVPLRITVYSGNLLKEQLGSQCMPLLAEHTDLWLAQYTTGTPLWPKGTYPHWTLWQYSESGRVDGITGTAVDLNRFAGTDDELLAWVSPPVAKGELASTEQPQVPEPLPPARPEVSITVPAGVAIRVNGKLVE